VHCCSATSPTAPCGTRKVGTGFTQATLRELAGKLTRLERDTSPFADEVRERSATWVKPQLVAQVGFSEWTRDGRLRHPRFLGLREDKPAGDVVRDDNPTELQPVKRPRARANRNRAPAAER
jgi:ATP-dependent DNA ligase